MKYKFFEIKTSTNRLGVEEIFPDFMTKKTDDFMIRGGKFYAILDMDSGMWITDEYYVQIFVDRELKAFEKELIEKDPQKAGKTMVRTLTGFKNKTWKEYRDYVTTQPDRFNQLDDKICFEDTKVSPKDYISKRLTYSLADGPCEAWDKIVGTLYEPLEREKLEWAIGAVISGESKSIQKFMVLYGDPGSGKGTILNILQNELFPGYYEVFDAKTLSNSNNNFSFEQFRSNPLIAIQMDGDLSKIQDNTKLNSLISHETVVMNEKRKQSYNFKPRCFLFMASNNPVDINHSKSGIIRRLIDVNPSGRTLPTKEYDNLMGQIHFERGQIAKHCLDVFRKLGKNAYNGYKPRQMMELTNPIYNFVLDNYSELFLEREDGISAKEAYGLWTVYCEANSLQHPGTQFKFKEELKSYFNEYVEMKRVSKNEVVRGWFCGGPNKAMISDSNGGKKFIPHDDPTFGLVLDQTVSLLDDALKDCQAQYAEDDGHGGSKPITSWNNCTTTLKNIDTSKLHFVRVPKNHIVIDFDLKNEKGEKDALLNLEAADKWPKTYAEYSQGGKGIHLHYIYDGNPDELASVFAKDIEIKVYSGLSSLRRRVSLCNNIPIRTLSEGLPKKEVKSGEMVDFDTIKNEQHIINIVSKCLRKDIAQPYTTPAMSLIKKTLDDAYASGIHYDIRDMRPAIRAFAAKSSHQKENCMKIESELHYCDHDTEQTTSSTKVDNRKTATYDSSISDSVEAKSIPKYVDETLVFFDIEVFPNLLLVNWKEAGEGKGVVRMINPTRAEINELFHRKLVGFNCRRYDNHILYARARGYDIPAIYRLSQRIISGSSNAMFGEAYNISYTDVYDFAAKKQSLKKWEIALGIHHQELGLPWDQPVPEERWAEVAAYCDNDVLATEAVFNKLAGDFQARKILAEIAGMSVNDTTNQLTTRIIFGDDPKPQAQFNYPDLAKKFPGYKFENGKSTLNGVEIGEGGRVYARPGFWRHVITFDVASMHPSSIIAENGFGKYTDGFKQLLDIRIAIKHQDFETAKKMLNGRLAKYLDDPEQADALSQALKIAINSVYGLTAAGFDNKFRDPRNKDNWVAKRGALFIETLRLKVTEMGGQVVHIKTDSIKVQEPTQEIKDFIISFGKQWGYTFEVEDIYEKMCLVNDAVYIALRDKEDPGWLKECRKAKLKAEETGKPYVEPTRWAATGAQFQHPYVFKHLFSGEEIKFEDLCETKTVTSALYLDMNEKLSDVSVFEKDLEKLQKRAKTLLKAEGYSGSWDEWPAWRKENPDEQDQHDGMIYAELDDLLKDQDVLKEMIAKGHNYVFIGKAGSFCPVKAGCGGGILVREKDGKFNAATGSKGYRWMEGESLKGADRMDLIDMGYFEELCKAAKEAIEEYVNFELFVDEKPDFVDIEQIVREADQDVHMSPPPWLPPCGDEIYENCYDCPNFGFDENGQCLCKREFDLSGYSQMMEIMNETAALKNGAAL